MDEEEKAYLFDIQQNASSFRQTRRHDQQRSFLRPKSSVSLDRNLSRDSPLFNHHHLDENPWSDYPRTDSRSTTHTNVSSVQLLPSPVMGGRLRTLQSPFHGSSAASSVTATLSNVRPRRLEQALTQDYASVVSLGPATKRALESLQAEVIALNERIDDLRHELLRRDRASTSLPPADDDDEWDGWKWVIKVIKRRMIKDRLDS